MAEHFFSALTCLFAGNTHNADAPSAARGSLCGYGLFVLFHYLYAVFRD
jgi:hypothetical protein